MDETAAKAAGRSGARSPRELRDVKRRVRHADQVPGEEEAQESFGPRAV